MFDCWFTNYFYLVSRNLKPDFITTNSKIMKRIKLLFSFALVLMASVAFGQKEKTISTFKEGTVLTADDIGFLSMVAAADLSKSRGSEEPTATIAGVTYKAGHVLSKSEAKSITKAVKQFQKVYKTPAESRGAGLCYYWYYYCDGWGYCYWYKYWYYC